MRNWTRFAPGPRKSSIGRTPPGLAHKRPKHELSLKLFSRRLSVFKFLSCRLVFSLNRTLCAGLRKKPFRAAV